MINYSVFWSEYWMYAFEWMYTLRCVAWVIGLIGLLLVWDERVLDLYLNDMDLVFLFC